MRRRSTGNRADTAWDAHRERGSTWLDLSYDEPRLRKIQDSLTPLGVDAGSLVGELQGIVLKFSGVPYWKFAPTPREVAGDMRETIAMIEALLERLDRRAGLNYLDPPTFDLLFPPLATLGAAEAALTALRAELQPRLDELTARTRGRGSGPSRNAISVHAEYWRELTQLWGEVTAHAASRRQHKHLHEFLYACSEPLFPKETTAKALTAFVDRHFPQTGA
jgi:hypothetical protein